jgi:hypothetical protein
MRKLRADTWQFAALGSSGEALPEESLALCVRCHAEALRAPLFGPVAVLEAQK